MHFSMRKFKYASDGDNSGKRGGRTLHEILGIKRELNLPYETLDGLTRALKTMNLVDMQALAMKMEVKPIGDRARLSRALTDQYIRLHKSYGCVLKRENEEPVTDENNFDPKNFG